MSIDWFRDLFIIVFTIVAVGLLIFIGVILLMLYNRAKFALNAVLYAAETVREISEYVKNEIAGTRPFLKAVTIIQGIREAVDIINRLTRKK